MKTIDLVIQDMTDEVFAISLVENPAIEEDFVALSKEKVMFKSVSDDKRIVVGFALIPNKEILRIDKKTGEPYNIRFSEETVREASELYLARMYNRNTTLEHAISTDKISVIESWIVENPEMDKIKLYGLSPIKGAWAITMKVYDDEIWNDVKNGKYYGFSIEGSFSNKEEELSDEDVLKEIKKLIKTYNGSS